MTLTVEQLEELREEVARIIDPHEWMMHDFGASREPPAPLGMIAGSLLKADTILALLSTARQAGEVGEGWVLVPREATEAMIEAYCAELSRLGMISWVNLSTIWPVVISASPSLSSVRGEENGGSSSGSLEQGNSQ